MEHADRGRNVDRCPKCGDRLAAEAEPGKLVSPVHVGPFPKTENARHHLAPERPVMGGSLVIECARATALDPLPGRTQSVLLVMAAHALDKPKGDKPARVYWLGHRTLALEIWGGSMIGALMRHAGQQ